MVNPHKKRKGKRMGKAIRASALILLLACSAQAGWMPNDLPTPPAQAGWMGNDAPAPGATQAQPTGGEISTTSAVGLTQIVLDLLAVLPSLP